MFFTIGAYATALFSKGFNVQVFGLTLAHAETDNVLGRAAAVGGHRRAVGMAAGAHHRPALERHLLLDDHAGVRAGDLLRHVPLERAHRRRGRDAEHRAAQPVRPRLPAGLDALLLVLRDLRVPRAVRALLDPALAVRQRAARDPREQAARALSWATTSTSTASTRSCSRRCSRRSRAGCGRTTSSRSIPTPARSSTRATS